MKVVTPGSADIPLARGLESSSTIAEIAAGRAADASPPASAVVAKKVTPQDELAEPGRTRPKAPRRRGKRQLLLPMIERRRRPAPALHATRDLTEAQFQRAVERNGFVHLGGLRFADVTGATDRVFRAAIAHTVPVRIARRETLAKLLKERANV